MNILDEDETHPPPLDILNVLLKIHRVKEILKLQKKKQSLHTPIFGKKRERNEAEGKGNPNQETSAHA